MVDLLHQPTLVFGVEPRLLFVMLQALILGLVLREGPDPDTDSWSLIDLTVIAIMDIA